MNLIIKVTNLIKGHVNVIKLVEFQSRPPGILHHPQLKIVLVIGEILKNKI